MRNVITAVMLLAFVASCGANTRTKALRAGLVSLNTARDTAHAVEHKRAEQIIAAATSKEEGRAQLDAWRAKVDPVFVALEAGYQALFSANMLNDSKSASDALAAVARALALVKELSK